MKKLSFFLLLILIVLASFPVWMPMLGKFLLVPDRLEAADSIAVLRGKDYFTFQKVLEIYRRDLAHEIVVCALPPQEKEQLLDYQFQMKVSGGEEITPAEFIRRGFLLSGLEDPSALVILEKNVDSTFEEALAFREWMTENGRKSFILVTATYHMRRALIIFKLVFHGTGIEIYPVTAKNPIYQPEAWWRKENDVKRVFEEYVSLAFNFLYHFIFQQGSTDFDSV